MVALTWHGVVRGDEMKKRRYNIILTREYEVELLVNEALTPDDEWRATFYNMNTLQEMAEHIAYNLCMFGNDAFVEGAGNAGDDTFTLISITDAFVDDVSHEIIEVNE